jgi:hypothetical protein
MRISKVQRIKALISNVVISDARVKREISKLDPEKTSQNEAEEIISLLQEKRSEFFKKWQLEIAGEYM